MLRKLVLIILIAFTTPQVIAQTPPVMSYDLRASVSASMKSATASDKAKLWLQSAVEGMGGEGRLRAIKTISIKGNGHTHLLEQSERPAGPWLVSYEKVSELRDLENRKSRQTIIASGTSSPPEITSIISEGMTATTFKFNGQASPMRTAPADEEKLSLSPERLLLNALEATDLHDQGDEVLQDVPQHVVAFTWGKVPVRIYLNAHTSLPTAYETVQAYPYDGFWGVWGDVRSRTYFSYWTLEPGGIRYPRQWDIERNGLPYKSFTIAELMFNAPVTADSFIIPADVLQAFRSRKPPSLNERPLGRPDKPAQEIAPNVVLIPGSWNIALVRQPDGIVVIEAPISSGYSAKVIAEVSRRFQGAAIKAVVSTSDAWPHIGGVREYVARGIPIYVLDLNRPILERLISAPHRFVPDSLARGMRRPIFRVVSRKTIIGAGPNRLEIHPIRTETGERMMMIYLPEHHLLYGSDLVQGAQPDGSFYMPQYLSELMGAVKREGLIVDTVFAMHTGPTPFDSIARAVALAMAEAK
jgi:hypothetical protein